MALRRMASLLVVVALLLVSLPVFAQADDDETPAEPAQATASVLVAHLAPFADTVEGTAVEVRVVGIGTLVDDFTYGETAGYFSVPVLGVPITIQVFLPGETTPVLTQAINLQANQTYTIVAVGDIVNQPLELLQLTDDNSVPPPGTGKLRVVHAAPFAATLADTEVSVRDEDGNVVGGLNSVFFKDASPYLELPAGNYDLQVTTPDGTTQLIDILPRGLIEGQVLTLFAIGNGTLQPLGIQPVFGNPRPPARVNILHLAPFANTIEGTSVTVSANSLPLLTDFTFGQSSGYLELPPGLYNLTVTRSGETTPAITGSIVVDSGEDYSVAAIGGANGLPLELLVAEDDNSAPAAGNAKVRVIHAAPFAANASDLLVSVRDEANNVVGGLSSVAYRAVSDYLELPAGTSDLQIANPDGSEILLDIPPLTLAAGEIVNIIASGDGTNQPLNALTIYSEPRDAAMVRVAHLAPFAAADTAVNVAVDGVEVLTNFSFGDYSDYLMVPAGDYEVTIAPSGTPGSPVLTSNLTFFPGGEYTISAIGGTNGWPLDLLPLNDATPPPSPQAKLRVVHVAPFAADPLETVVSIRTEAGTVVGGLSNVAYRDVSGFLPLASQVYDLQVATPDGGSKLIEIPPLTLKPGDEVTVYAIGDGTNQDLGILLLQNETLQVFLPIVVR